MSKPRRVLYVVLCLLSGLVVSLGVAIAAPLIDGQYVHSPLGPDPADRVPDHRLWRRVRSPEWPLDGRPGFHSRLIGHEYIWMIGYRKGDDAGYTSVSLEWFEQGWPMRCLSGGTWSAPPKSVPVELWLHRVSAGRGSDLAWQRHNQMFAFWIPCLPIWRGLFVNTFFYATVLAAFSIGTRRLLAWNRYRSVGRCPKCRYRLHDAGGCPECGHGREAVA